MKTLKTIAVATLFMIGSVSFAQGPQGGMGGGRQMRSSTERAKTETEQLTKTLSLDATQSAKMYDINLKYAQQDSVRFAGMRANNQEVDRDKMMQEMRASQEAKSAEVNAILTDDQKAGYKKYLEERQQRGPGGQRPGGTGEGAPAGGDQPM